VAILDGKTVSLTGGTGTLSDTLVKIALEEHEPTVIGVLSRGELLQIQIERRFKALDLG